jgi:flagellar biosynthesis protein FlhB
MVKQEKELTELILPFLIVLAFSVAIVIRLQIGNVFCPKKIKFDLENMSPSKMLKNAQKI